ncbi:uncharacterized protein METZ01_LOCUS237754, partial [marine metagenome]
MKWGPFHDMNYMFIFLSNYGDAHTSDSEIHEMSTKLVNQIFERDR